MRKLIAIICSLLTCAVVLSMLLPGVRERLIGAFISAGEWAENIGQSLDFADLFSKDDGDDKGNDDKDSDKDDSGGKDDQKDPENEEQTPESTPQQPAQNVTIVARDDDLHEALKQAIAQRHTELDVSELGYSADYLKDELSRFFFSNPSLFYVNNSFSYYKEEGSSTVKTVVLSYLYDAQESEQMSAEYEQVVEQIVSGIPTGASEFDKVLYLHDYLVRNYAYDYEGLQEEVATGNAVAIRDAYTFFKEKRGVCQAYMLAMIALCKEAGIESLPVISDELVHAWNLVKLDGVWYHVDVTWDDAGGEESAVYPSFVSYQYFLLSDQALYSGSTTRKPRTARWESVERANDATYDFAKWRGAATPMAKLGQDYYCVLFDKTATTAKLYRGQKATMSEVKAFEDEKWFGAPNSYYTSAAWAGLAVWEGKLLISTNTEFHWYDPQSGTLTKIADISAQLGGKQIFGIYDVDADGTVYYVAANDYKGTFAIREWEIPAA